MGARQLSHLMEAESVGGEFFNGLPKEEWVKLFVNLELKLFFAIWQIMHVQGSEVERIMCSKF